MRPLARRIGGRAGNRRVRSASSSRLRLGALALTLFAACSSPPPAQGSPAPPREPEPSHPSPHTPWLTLQSKLPDALLANGQLTYRDLDETRGLRTVRIDADSVVRCGDTVWFDPRTTEAAGAEAACMTAARGLRRRGLAEGFLEVDEVEANGIHHRPIFQTLHLFIDDAVVWETSVEPLMRACGHPEIAFWTIELHCDPDLVPARYKR